jgi:hypothetical protein
MRLVALLLVVACGDNLPDPGTPHSGQRLKLGWYEYADGTRQRETSWYFDSELGERCTPTAWSDGNRYCTPAHDEAIYVSDACSRAVGRTRIDSTPASFFATSFMLFGELQLSRVFRRGAPTTAPLSMWVKHQNGCYGPFEPGDGFEYFELGAEVPDLVQLRRSAPHGRGELAIIDETSADGLRAPIGFYDRPHDVECSPAEQTTSDTVECVPANAALVSYFHEVGCIEPELAYTGNDVPVTAKQYSPITRCWQYYKVGAEVSAPPLYESLPLLGTCVATAPPAGARFYLVAPQQLSVLPGLLREREQTTRRLARIDLVADDVRVPDVLLYDRELEGECRRDDQLRCIPVTDAVVEPFFADSSCTIPLDLALVPTGDCDPPAKLARRGDQLFRLGQPYTLRIHWLSTGDTCGTYAPPAPFVAWAIGPAIDPATFVQAQLAIDP